MKMKKKMKTTMKMSYLVIKVGEVRTAIEVKRSDAGDVSPVAMFFTGPPLKI